MFALFPSLFTFSFFAPTILRLGVGILLILFAYRTKQAIKGSEPSRAFLWYIILAETLIGISLLVGFWMQLGALLGMLLSLKLMYLSKKEHRASVANTSTYALILIICFSLLLTGAGALAFDLPL